MKLMKQRKIDNRGFSLVELIVVIAIMAIAVGTLTLSVSMVTGAESKKAFQKLESLIDETRTGAMSRFDQQLTVCYKSKDASYDGTDVTGEYDADGFYGIMNMTTLKAEVDTSDPEGDKHPKATPISVSEDESRLLCKDNVQLSVECASGSSVVTHYIGADSTSNILIKFNHATGMYDQIVVTDAAGGTTTINYNNISKSFNDGTNDVQVYIVAKSGMRSHRMELIGETGKHERVDW